jgi:hypothetical protein
VDRVELLGFTLGQMPHALRNDGEPGLLETANHLPMRLRATPSGLMMEKCAERHGHRPPENELVAEQSAGTIWLRPEEHEPRVSRGREVTGRAVLPQFKLLRKYRFVRTF